uniref:Uncharacterized protein n=1 Tax=Labrus bergylta TaxID=56723 RepID=A0A3Q3MZY5_9LABR
MYSGPYCCLNHYIKVYSPTTNVVGKINCFFLSGKWFNERCEGPFEVVRSTGTAVQVKRSPNWYHLSHCVKVPTEEAPRSQNRDDDVWGSAVLSPKNKKQMSSCCSVKFCINITLLLCSREIAIGFTSLPGQPRGPG